MAGVRDFMIVRWGRLYPLHFVMLAAWVATEFALAVAGNDGTSGRRAFDPPFTLSGIGPQLLLLQAVGSDQGETWNWVAWSISVEFWTYLLFAVGVFFSDRGSSVHCCW